MLFYEDSPTLGQALSAGSSSLWTLGLPKLESVVLFSVALLKGAGQERVRCTFYLTNPALNDVQASLV